MYNTVRSQYIAKKGSAFMDSQRHLTDRQKRWIAGSGLALFFLLSALVCWFAGRPLIHFAQEPELFRQWVDQQGIWAPVLFTGMVILQVVVAVIPGEPLEIAAGYARIVGPSYILNSITGVYVGAHRSMENPKLGLIIFSISMCANTFLNWVLIFGNLGAPALGVVGAAAATLTSRVVEFVVMAIYALTNRRFRLQFSLLLRPSGELVGKFVRYSSPVVLNETMWGLGTTLYKVVMGHMEGSAAILAARALAGNIEDICSVAIFAVAGSTAIIVGREIGAGRRDTVYEVGATMNTLALLCGGVLGGLLVLAAHFLLPVWVYPIFDLSARSAGIATMMLTFTGATLALRAFNSTNIVGVLRGGGDVRAAMRIDILPLWAVALPLAALFGLALKWGIFWVYIGITMEQVSKFGFGVGRFRSRAWINDVTVASYQRAETPGQSLDA